jgi:hypothetical protein
MDIVDLLEHVGKIFGYTFVDLFQPYMLSSVSSTMHKFSAEG